MLPILYSTPDQIQSLIDNEVAEGKNLEYKLEVPGGSREDGIEFLADVSSFSNSSGGAILYGIRAENGIATENMGIENQTLDQAILRMENMIRDGIRPRIAGIQISRVESNDTHCVLVVTIPKSFNSPHFVDYQRHWRVYGRNSAGKYQFDIDELRTSINATDNLSIRVRDFRTRRLIDIKTGDTPVRLQNNGLIALHLLPMEFNERGAVDITTLTRDAIWIHRNMAPINGGVVNHRYNMDGYLTLGQAADPAFVGSYVQFFRNGAIESVDSTLMQRPIDGIHYLPSTRYEEELRSALPRYLSLLEHFGINPPVICMVSFVNVRGHVMGISQRLRFNLDLELNRLDRDDLVIPEVLIESLDADPDEILKPIFDNVWNAFGFQRSFNYNAAGNWESQ